MELFTWSSDFDLPSWNQRCLAMLAYSKFTGAPITVRQSDNPFWTREGDLPVFRHGKFETSCFQDIVQHLEECKFSADFNLSAKQKAESVAFKKMLEDQLEPALALVFWIDARNLVEVTRPWFAKRLPFPLAFVYPRRYQEKAKALIYSATSIDCHAEDSAVDVDFSIMERAVMDTAEECLKSVSLRLGNQAFMYGNAPSSLDALVFSYVAPLLKVNLPNQQMPNIVKKFANIESFVSRVLTVYFPGISTSPKRQNRNNTNGVSTSDLTEEKSEKSWANNFAALAVAVLAMAGYAFTSGLMHAVRSSSKTKAGAAMSDTDDESS